MTDETRVPGSEGGVSQVETPVAPDSGVAAKPEAQAVTPAQSPNPVDVEALRARYEQDINKLKSTLQRQTAQVEKEWQSRYTDLQRQLQETRMATMTDEERARYERQLESEEFQSLQSRLAELENERALQAQTVNAYQFFVAQGVPADKLNLAEGYDAVAQAGWQYLTEELSRLRQATANPPQPVSPEPEPLPEAPRVVNDKGTPTTGTTWAALRSQGWSDEAIYRAVESGRLPASVIPTE